ncbi:MAG TPA: helicase-associated domain-containing protein [Spirochaetia bacterium]|nr:helicase-associated domain-containing protein [Spirochaetia bacterium]
MSYLSQCLQEMPATDVGTIAAALAPGSATAGGRKADMFILERLLDEGFLADLLRKLNDEELRTISLFVWWASTKGIPKGDTWLAMARLDSPQRELDSLMHKGIVFEARDGKWGKYFVPEDLAAKLSRVLAHKCLPRPLPLDEDVSENIFSGNFYEDCLTLLTYVHQDPVILTQKGTIPKRIITKLTPLMQFKEEITISWPFIDYCSFRFWLLHRYCLYIKALIPREPVLTVQTNAVVQWLKQKPLSRIYQTIPFMWNICFEKCPIPSIKALLKLIAHMDQDRWFGYAELAGAARNITGYTWQSPGPEDLLEAFLDAGLLTEGLTRKGERVIRFGFWSPRNEAREFPALPGEEDGFWVQPNFEVLAPPWLQLVLRWQLAMLAEPVKMDHAFTYALTKKAALRFFKRGGSAPEMLDFLARHSKKPLPQNVSFTIREWGLSTAE